MLCAEDNHRYFFYICVKGFFLDSNLIKQLLTKYQCFTKLHQISHIYKNHIFLSIIETFRPTASIL